MLYVSLYAFPCSEAAFNSAFCFSRSVSNDPIFAF